MTEPKIPYVYIAGLSHSGSTLLGFLLNAHPRMLSVGEAFRLGEILPDRWLHHSGLCSCGKTFTDCDFWIRTLAGLAARGFGLRASDPFDGPVEDWDVDWEKWSAFVEAALEVGGADVFVDASKPAKYIPWLEAHPGLDVRYLNLLRDGRGVVHSWRKHNPDSSFSRLVRTWMDREEERQMWLAAAPAGRVLDVQYERLCSFTEETLGEVYKHVGLDLLVQPAGFKTQAEHHIIGNQMRLDANEKIRLDEAWRRALTTEELAAFVDLGGAAVNARNGYHD